MVLSSMLSYSSNKWKSDVDAFVRPEANPNDIIQYHAFTDNLYVGNYPMTMASLGCYYENSISPNTKIYINPIYNFYGRYYAQFDPVLRINETDKGIQSWRLPDFYNIDFHFGVDFQFQNKIIQSMKISFNVFNILNNEYIADAIDGISHNSQSALVWFGRERWWSTSISFML